MTWFCFPAPHSSLPACSQAHQTGTGPGQRRLPSAGALAWGSAALLALFTQLQQTPEMKVRPRSVLLRKSPSLFLRKRKTNIFLSLRRRGGVWARVLRGAWGCARSCCSRASPGASAPLHRGSSRTFPFLWTSPGHDGRGFIRALPASPGSVSVPKGRASATSLLPSPCSGPGAREVKPTRRGSPDPAWKGFQLL